MISKYDIKEGNSLLLLKFINEEHMGFLLDGNIFTNNFEYFRQLEKNSGVRGIGDKDEASLIINEVTNFTMIDSESNNQIIKVPNIDQIKISYKEDDRVPIFCLYNLGYKDLKVIEETEDNLMLLLEFSEEEKRNIKKEFKDKTHVVIFEYHSFINKLTSECKNNDLTVSYGKTKYYNEKVNDSKRLSDFNNNNIGKYFWKKECFKGQSEFRVVFTDKQINKGSNIVKIDNLSEIATHMTIDKLLEEKHSLNYSLRKRS